MESELYKTRSLSSCMKSAYDMFVSNIKTIFHRTWLPAVLFAVFSAVSMVLFYNTIIQSYTTVPMAGSSSFTHIFILAGFAILLLLLSIAASVWFYAIVISLLDGASMKVNLPRVIRIALLIIALTLVISIIVWCISVIPYLGSNQKGSAPEAWGMPAVVSMAIYLCFAIAMIPTLYSSMKYLMEPEQKLFSVFGKPYLRGWRHWGYLFMLCFLAGIIVSIIYIVVNMPANIDAMAVATDGAGMMLGDATGLPGYFQPVAAIATFLSSFIMIYVGSWFLIIMYYAYGHIEAKEKAKKEQKLAMQKIRTQIEPDFEEVK